MNQITLSHVFLNQTKVNFSSILSAGLMPKAGSHAGVSEWAFRQTTVTDKFCRLLEKRFPMGTTIIVDGASIPEIVTLRACQVYPKFIAPKGRVPSRLPVQGIQNEGASIADVVHKYPIIAHNKKIDWMHSTIPIEKPDRLAIEVSGFSNFVKTHFIPDSSQGNGARFYTISDAFRKSFGTNLHERNVLEFWQNQPPFEQPVAVVTQNWWNELIPEKRIQLVKLMQDKLPTKSIVRIGVNELVVDVDKLLKDHGFKPASEIDWIQPDYSTAKQTLARLC